MPSTQASSDLRLSRRQKNRPRKTSAKHNFIVVHFNIPCATFQAVGVLYLPYAQIGDHIIALFLEKTGDIILHSSLLRLDRGR